MKFTVFSDRRGNLLPINFSQLRFTPKRIFIIDSENGMRGGHAHKENEQILVCLNGTIKIYTAKPKKIFTTHILKKGECLYHPNMEWAIMEFSDGKLLSFCSHEYDSKDYIYDFNSFQQMV